MHQRFDAFAVNGADGENFFEAEFGKFGRAGFGPIGIHFVDRDKNGFAAATKSDGGFTVEWDNAFLNVDDEDNDVGGFDGEFDLFQSGTGNDVVRFLTPKEADAASIDKGKSATVPFRLRGDPIAGYTRAVVNDGNATADNPIEECGFSDVRATDDSDESRHATNMEQKMALRKKKWYAKPGAKHIPEGETLR